MSDKQEKNPAGAGDTASPSAYFTHFENGRGQILHIAKMLIEATGQADPKRVEALGGEPAKEIRRKRSDHDKHNYTRNRLGFRSEPFGLQGDFDHQVNLVVGELLEAARREGWRVMQKSGVQQKSPNASGYVDVMAAHDHFAKALGHNHPFADVLRSAAGSKSDFPVSARPIDTSRTSSSSPGWWLKPKVLRDDGLAGALHKVLQQAYRDGQPKPNARQVLDTFLKEKEKFSVIVRVLSDGCDYASAAGDEKFAGINKIQKRIGDMTNQQKMRQRSVRTA